MSRTLMGVSGFPILGFLRLTYTLDELSESIQYLPIHCG